MGEIYEVDYNIPKNADMLGGRWEQEIFRTFLTTCLYASNHVMSKRNVFLDTNYLYCGNYIKLVFESLEKFNSVMTKDEFIYKDNYVGKISRFHIFYDFDLALNVCLLFTDPPNNYLEGHFDAKIQFNNLGISSVGLDDD